MKKSYVIYLHKNKINGKCYIGQTCQDPNNRWMNGQGYKDQPYFYRAIQKYGWDNFDHIILEEDLTADEADQQEVFWAGYYHALAPEGYTLQVGKNSHQESSLMFSEMRREQALECWQNPDYRLKVINGRKLMWEQADENKKNRMLANLDRSGKASAAKQKRVECVETGEIYTSVREAERATGIPHSNISQVCNGKRQTAHKFHWRFVG